MVLVVVGLTLLGTIDATTPLVEVGAFMALLGLGLGATMQNLVLAVQNNTAQADMGAASSVVSFFRSMGGSIGVSALGALLSHQVAQKVTDGLAALGIEGGHSTGTIPDLDALPAPVRALYEGAFGEATGHLFLVAAPFALLAFVCVLFIREVPLRTTLDRDGRRDRPQWPRGHRGPGRAGTGRGGRPVTNRADSLRHLEREVGVLIRRIKRVIGERARAVHEDLQPASYLMLSWLVDEGPVRASAMVEKFSIDKGAVSRQLQHLDDLGLVEPDAGPRRRPRHAGRRPATTPGAGWPTWPSTGASGSTSSWATGRPRSSRPSRPRWRSTTVAQRLDLAEPDRGVGRQQPALERRCSRSAPRRPAAPPRPARR